MARPAEAAVRIAILGWGSLIWDPKNLSTEGEWQPDGPCLPIEFARVSSGNRLTAVLYEGAEVVKTYWIKSSMLTLEGARENLRCREGCPKIDCTGDLTREGHKQFKPFMSLDELLTDWLAERPSLDTVVWTDLRSNFSKKTGKDFSTDNAQDWLRNLIKQKNASAAEWYIRKAPLQTDTPLRRRVREVFGWTDVSQPTET